MDDPSIYDLHEPQWCPGCGNFALLDAVKEALSELDIKPHELLVACGIGQAGKFGFSLKANLFAGLHGRMLPLAWGMKIANHKAPVLVVSGDGCFFAEGGNHFIHNLRRNLDVTMIASDNRVFGLTKGQASPTAEAVVTTKIQPEGGGAAALNPCALALVSGATFVARSFTGNREELIDLIKRAFRHRGAAFIDLLSPCVSFNQTNTFAWYRQHTAPLDANHETTDFDRALHLARCGDDQGRLVTGLLYQVAAPVFGEGRRVLQGEILARKMEARRPTEIKRFFPRFRG
ncbi:MAG: 2-oxoacid ferredoxin oxidoreductase [Deltaproteobacteria bacterium]|nr:2-oxoacid ferredoxin oxidoreductase [Deltaproteobacteria bacterium]